MTQRPFSVAVVGAGNWGTTLAHLVARNGIAVTLWTRDEKQRDEINRDHTNRKAVRGLALAPSVRATSDIAEAAGEVDLVIMAIPSSAFREVARRVGDVVTPEQMVVHVTKGFEAETRKRMSEILVEETSAAQIGVIAGPNIAAEIAPGKPAGTVVASRFPRVVEAGKRALASPQMMVFEGSDVLGVEICGALKNVVAIAAGMADEMGVGDNAKALLVTRGMAELMRLAFAMGAEPLTMTGLAGIGDLMVTCESPLSRNHRVGAALASGLTLDVYASRSARELAREYSIDMPLFLHVDRVLHEGLAPSVALETLMRLPTGRDVARFARRA